MAPVVSGRSNDVIPAVTDDEDSIRRGWRPDVPMRWAFGLPVIVYWPWGQYRPLTRLAIVRGPSTFDPINGGDGAALALPRLGTA